MLLADLTEEQRTTLQQVLDGMVRERSGGAGSITISNTVNIGIGVK
jgi:hypothetical protein